MSSVTSTTLRERSAAKMFGGWVRQYQHDSSATRTPMNFSVFLPPQAETGRVPVLIWLSGLTCTDENFLTKAGAQRLAAELGLMLVMPDTSPRGAGIEGEKDSWDFGVGAGFYVDATVEKWATNYNMHTYITKELLEIIHEHFPTQRDCVSIFGHSMGGHGALVCFLRNPGLFRSVSAFAPICHPSACPWGHKAFSGFLGEDTSAWAAYDACELAKTYTGPAVHVLIDQGEADTFLSAKQLLPDDFVAAAAANAAVSVTLRMQPGYDHSYYFIASFVEDHIRHHHAQLRSD